MDRSARAWRRCSPMHSWLSSHTPSFSASIISLFKSGSLRSGFFWARPCISPPAYWSLPRDVFKAGPLSLPASACTEDACFCWLWVLLWTRKNGRKRRIGGYRTIMLTTPDTTATLAHPQMDGDAAPAARVCMLLLGFAPNDVRVLREATALREAGFAVTIIDMDRRPDGPRSEEIQGVSIQHIRMPQWYQPSRVKLWFLVKLAIALLRIFGRSLRTPADIYHAHEEQVLLVGYLIARVKRKPLIFDAHELPLTDHSVTRWSGLHAMATWLLRRVVPSCAGVITVSPPLADEIRRLYRSPEVTLVRNVPIYRAVEKQDRVRQRLNLDQKTRIALYQGYVLPDRGFDRLDRKSV